MHYIIYQITNTVNGKIYIGCHQTSNLQDGYMGSGRILLIAMRKYGESAFSKEVLHVFDNPTDMFEKEAELVTEDFCRRTDTYNIKVGGMGGWDYVNRQGLQYKEWTQEQLSLGGRLGQKRRLERFDANPEFKQNVYDKVSASLKRRYHKHPHHSKGVTKTTEHRNRISQSNTGTKWMTDGSTSIKVPAAEVLAYLDAGWKLGMKSRK